MRLEILERKNKTVEMKILLKLFNKFEKIRGNHSAELRNWGSLDQWSWI